jgi:hypothetical protein
MAGFCGNCGQPVDTEGGFCGACGSRIEQVQGARASEVVGPARSPALVPDRPRPPQTSKRSTRRWTWLVVASIVVVLAAASIVLVAGRHQSPGSNVKGSASSGSAATSTSQPTAAEEVQSLARLLAISASQRAAVRNATSEIANCGALQSAQDSLSLSATQRQQNLNALQSMSLDQVPDGARLKQDLNLGWTASIASDRSYALVAADQIANQCATPVNQDSNWIAAQSTDGQASQYKEDFATVWNSIAAQYNVPTYDGGQI